MPARVRCQLAVLALASAPFLATSARAQTAACATAAVELQDGCQKTVDLFNYLVPQLATAVAGGNAVLGQGGTLGGLGHFAIGVQTNIVKGNVPKFDNISTSINGAQQTDFNTTVFPVPMPSAVAGIGLFGGLPLGIVKVASLDAMVSAIYIPSVTTNNVSLKPKTPVQIGYGGRLGIVQETPVSPAVSVTFMERDLPTTTLSGTDGQSDTLTVRDLSLKTTAWRIVASKNFLILGLALGAGSDNYRGSTTVDVALSPASGCGQVGACSGTVASPAFNITRTNYFGDLSLNMAIFHIVFEVGDVAGKTISTFNTFDGQMAGDSRLYGSVGFLFKF